MAYVATLGNSRLAIALQEMQTKITLMSSSLGQQQSQSSSFYTGKWQTTPELRNVGQGAVLQLNSDRGSYYIHILSNTINMVDPPTDLQNYSTIDLKEVEDSQTADFKPIEPMPSMQPTQMGDMSMDINDPAKSTTTKQFCSQCGTEAKTGDRFCRSCGHELNK